MRTPSPSGSEGEDDGPQPSSSQRKPESGGKRGGRPRGKLLMGSPRPLLGGREYGRR